jgi:hypothetical protein
MELTDECVRRMARSAALAWLAAISIERAAGSG